MTPAVRILVLVAATIASYPIGLFLGQAWLLPILNTLPAYVAMVLLLRGGDRRHAVGAMLAWAATLAVVGTLSLALWPSPPDAVVIHGTEYRAEMFAWIRTGSGTEGSIRLFLPQHLGHLAGFVLLSLLTASALSILLGAVLMNYMAFYVASLFRAGVAPTTVLLFGWQPWAVCRVSAFCILGAVLAEPLISRLSGRPHRAPGVRNYLVAAAGLILADWLLKWAFAPAWGLVLRGALGR